MPGLEPRPNLMTTITAQVDVELSHQLRIEAAKIGISKSAAIREAVQFWLAHQNAAPVLRDFVEAITDEYTPAFREPILTTHERKLLERACKVLGIDR